MHWEPFWTDSRLLQNVRIYINRYIHNIHIQQLYSYRNSTLHGYDFIAPIACTDFFSFIILLMFTIFHYISSFLEIIFLFGQDFMWSLNYQLYWNFEFLLCLKSEIKISLQLQRLDPIIIESFLKRSRKSLQKYRRKKYFEKEHWFKYHNTVAIVIIEWKRAWLYLK